MEKRETNAAIYARADHETVDAVADLERQHQECADAARRLGAHVVSAFFDLGHSQTPIEERPGLTRLAQSLQETARSSRAPEYLIVSSIDRLGEEGMDVTRILLALMQHGVQVAIAESDTIINVHTPQDSVELESAAIHRQAPEPEKERQQPEYDTIPDHEIDLTGVVDQTKSLIDIIGDAIATAGPDNELPEWGARATARLLANRQTEGPTALHHFAVTGRIDYPRISDEMAKIWQEGQLSGLVAEAFNRLGTYLLAQRREGRNPARPEFTEAIRALIGEHGPAFEAFMSLPNVDEEAAEATFQSTYVGSYDHTDDIVADVADALDLQQTLDDSDVAHFANIDPTKVMRMARETYDIVRHKGRYYCFWK